MPEITTIRKDADKEPVTETKVLSVVKHVYTQHSSETTVSEAGKDDVVQVHRHTKHEKHHSHE